MVNSPYPVMRHLLALALFAFLHEAGADILCYKGDILHKGKIAVPETDETAACRLHLEMMDATCGDDQVDVVAQRAGSNAKVNGTIGCELLAGDKAVECECSTEKCNTPTLEMKNAIAALVGTTDEEKKILQCFIAILETKFGLATTSTIAPAQTTTATVVETTVVVHNVTTAKPDSSAAFCVLPLLAATLLVGF